MKVRGFCLVRDGVLSLRMRFTAANSLVSRAAGDLALQVANTILSMSAIY